MNFKIFSNKLKHKTRVKLLNLKIPLFSINDTKTILYMNNSFNFYNKRKMNKLF